MRWPRPDAADILLNSSAMCWSFSSFLCGQLQPVQCGRRIQNQHALLMHVGVNEMIRVDGSPDSASQFASPKARDITSGIMRHLARYRIVNSRPGSHDECPVVFVQRRHCRITAWVALREQVTQAIVATVPGMKPPRYVDICLPKRRCVCAGCASSGLIAKRYIVSRRVIQLAVCFG